jgi:hypothetical protein
MFNTMVKAAGFQQAAPRKEDPRGREYGYYEVHDGFVRSVDLEPGITVRKYSASGRLEFSMIFLIEEDFLAWARNL